MVGLAAHIPPWAFSAICYLFFRLTVIYQPVLQGWPGPALLLGAAGDLECGGQMVVDKELLGGAAVGDSAFRGPPPLAVEDLLGFGAGPKDHGTLVSARGARRVCLLRLGAHGAAVRGHGQGGWVTGARCRFGGGFPHPLARLEGGSLLAPQFVWGGRSGGQSWGPGCAGLAQRREGASAHPGEPF